MGAVPVETELKLRVPAAAMKGLINHPVLRAGQRLPPQKLKAVYYDTPQLDLCRSGAALRVRREGGRWVQTVKWNGTARAGLHERSELEIELPGPNPDISRIEHSELATLFQAARVAGELRPVFETDVTRAKRLLVLDDDVVVEASLDRGEIRSGGRSVAVSELELELKRGAAPVLFEVALSLIDRAPVALESRSKAERGYALWRDEAPAPVKAMPPALEASMSVSAAFTAIAWTTVQQLHANEWGVLESADPEYLHQMRVALRRLRSAISVFGDVIPEASRAPVAQDLRWLAAALGSARDWDVFVTETLPAVERTVSSVPAISALAAEASARRKSARRNAHAAIRSRRYQRATLGLASWISAEAWRKAAGPQELALLDAPVKTYAEAELERRYERVRKRGRKLASLDARELHELRIAIKKLRYSLDFFCSLFDLDRVRVLRSKLSRLQDGLGAFNDSVTIHRLLEDIGAGTQDPNVAEARGVLFGWAGGRAEGLRYNLNRAWRAFRRSETFW